VLYCCGGGGGGWGFFFLGGGGGGGVFLGGGGGGGFGGWGEDHPFLPFLAVRRKLYVLGKAWRGGLPPYPESGSFSNSPGT